MLFQTSYKYRDREEKALYVWDKYKKILNGKILDVGADKEYLLAHTNSKNYTSLGLEPFHDIHTNLENKLPIKNNSFDCVLCLDVLEHVENIHQLFDELCRVTRKYLIISLPNPWADFLRTLIRGYYAKDRPLKFYNLPLEPPKDRHRWFFNKSEAIRFIKHIGRRNNMEVLQIDQYRGNKIKLWSYKVILSLVLHKSVSPDDLLGDTIWAVLIKSG